MFRRRVLIGVLAAYLVSQLAPIAVAQPATPPQAATGAGSLTGTVTDFGQHPLAGVEVKVFGPVSRTTQTESDGSFKFQDLPPGSYTLNLTKPGFDPAQEVDNVLPGATATTKPQLAQVSLSSIKTIGRTSVTRNANALNTTTASVASVSGNAFVDQGQLSVSHLLNEIPGVSVGFSSGTARSGYGGSFSQLSSGYPTLRGSLPYETASLIDGHPIDLGVSGTFDPSFISPWMLEDVEIVKGPGALAPNINYAIGGTINFRTLQPTAAKKQSFDVGIDQFGGEFANLRATGTIAGRIGYAFDYATNGTQGPNRGYTPLNPTVLLAHGDLVNGQPVCANPAATLCGIGVQPLPTSPFFNDVNFTSPLVSCCAQVPLESSSRNELAKLRYGFSPTTSLTLTYLGAQLAGVPGLYTLPDYFFVPPAGYTGALPAGTELAQDNEYNTIYNINANLWSAEFATALGPVSLNARYYIVSDYSFLNANPPPTGFTGALYGGVDLGNSTTPTIFNGQVATIDYLHGQFGGLETDRLGGVTFQAAMPVGRDFFSISYDQVGSSTSAIQHFPPFNPDVPPGSGQRFYTIAAHGQFEVTPALQATLSDYQMSYTDRYTQDFGTTWLNSTHSYNAPRLALSWRPASDLAVRAAAGFSLAPPYAKLLTNTAVSPNGSGGGGGYFTVTNNSGDVRPETAFGIDFGADKRFAHDLVVSADLYQTTLHDQYLTTTTLSPTPYVQAPPGIFLFPAGSYPLYITKTANLGHSRYEGIELAIHRDPVFGLGYKLQGDLQRAYPYDLPPGFYDTPTGPNTTNLPIFPGENFHGTGGRFTTGLSPTDIPYSQGYGELNFRGRNGAYFLVGVTYYGPNNGNDLPPFAVVNASYRQPVAKWASLLVTATNITSAYSSYLFNDYGGVPTPLVNGKLVKTAGSTIGPSTTSISLHVDL